MDIRSTQMSIRNKPSQANVAQLHIDFEWWQDAEGYRLVSEWSSTTWSSTTAAQISLGSGVILSATGEIVPATGVILPAGLSSPKLSKPQRIVRCGGSLRSYRPLITFEGLFRLFANAAPTPEGVLDFIGRFGPLTCDGLDENQGEDVSLLIEHVEAMSKILNEYSHGHKVGLAQVLDSDGIQLGQIKTVLINDPATRMPRLQLTVADLLTALWLQLGQTLSSGATIRRCEQCGMLFEVGPGTTRRLDAKFCCDDHRITFNSQKRTKGR
jgi:hypothetical protein